MNIANELKAKTKYKKPNNISIGTFLILLLISVVSLVQLALLTLIQTVVVNFFTVFDITLMLPPTPGIILATILKHNLGLYISILFSMVYAYFVSSLFKVPNKKMLMLLNAASFFLVSFIVYLPFIIVGQGTIYFTQIFFVLPSNILCVVITQLLLALFFLKNPKHDHSSNARTNLSGLSGR